MNPTTKQNKYSIGWVWAHQNPQARPVFVSILRVETPQGAHWIRGTWLRGVVWSIHRDCISSFAFWFYPAYIATNGPFHSIRNAKQFECEKIEFTSKTRNTTRRMLDKSSA